MQYITSPFKPTPNAMTPGMPIYLWGSYNDKVGPTVGNVLSDSAASTTATVKVQILGGNIPKVGALITVVGTANSSGVFNVTNAAITSVSAAVVPDAGIYTIQFTISSTTQVSTLDAGQFIVPQPEIAEALVTDTASIPAVLPYNAALANLNQALTAVVTLVSTSSAAAVIYLQQAIQDLNSEYSNVCTVATITGGTAAGTVFEVTVDPTLGRFFRFYTGDLTGTGTIVAKLIM